MEIFFLLVAVVLVLLMIWELFDFKRDNKKIQSLLNEYSIEKLGSEWKGYHYFIRVYLETGIEANARENLNFSAFNMYYREVQNLLKVASIQNKDISFKETLHPILEQLNVVSEKHIALKDTNLNSELYNQMLHLHNQLIETSKMHILSSTTLQQEGI